MKKNIGKIDIIIRIVIGLLIVGLSMYFKSWWGFIAIIPLLTAAIGFCGLYSLFGIKTICKK